MDTPTSGASGAAGPVFAFEGTSPRIAAGVFIAPNATIIGDVEISEGASIWFNTVLRGDEEPIRIGPRSNIQDGTVIHTTRGVAPVDVGADVIVGHGAILHSCTVESGSMIGIGAIVLDTAVVEKGAVVAAGAVVPPGKRIGAGEMWAGCPAVKRRPVSDLEKGILEANPVLYAELARRYMDQGLGSG